METMENKELVYLDERNLFHKAPHHKFKSGGLRSPTACGPWADSCLQASTKPSRSLSQQEIWETSKTTKFWKQPPDTLNHCW